MPLNDDFQAERNLRDIGLKIANALAEVLNEEEHERYGFMLFIYDLRNGIMQYVSDIDNQDNIQSLELWLAKMKDRANEQKTKTDAKTD